jgi:hypothetical protein
MLVLALGALHCFFAAGQTVGNQEQGESTGSNPQIRGVVLESGVNSPISGADVALYYWGEDRPSVRLSLGSATPSATTTTDAGGRFVFHPPGLGYYTVVAKKDGYVQPATGEGASSRDITLTREKSTGEPSLVLSRPGRISGVVVDRNSGKPIPNLRVCACRILRINGRLLELGVYANTNSAGEFEAANLTAGEYVMKIMARSAEAVRIISKFAESDLGAIDQEFRVSYWPGGGNLDTAVPIRLESGSRLSVALEAEKVPHYCVHLRVPPGSCDAKERIIFTERIKLGKLTLGSAPCSSDILIGGFLPGAHELFAMLHRGPDETRTGVVPFFIKDENVEATLALYAGATVEISVAVDEKAAKIDSSEMTVALGPLNAVPSADLLTPRSVGPSGKLSFRNVPMGAYVVEVSQVASGAYVKEIRHGSSDLPDNIVSVGSAGITDISIHIDEGAATVTGIVMDHNNPVSLPFIVLVRWPLPASEYYQPLRVEGTEDGRFALSGLAPGEYAVLALRSRAEYDSRFPGTLERALQTSRKIELRRSATQNVVVDVGSLR